MSKYVRLAMLKKNVIAEDFDDDDELLAFLLEAAEREIVGMTQRDEADLVDADGNLPADLQRAILVAASFHYNNRAGSTPAEANALYNLLWSVVNQYREPKNRF